MVIINLALATICYLGSCHPVLIGKTTPVGEFSMVQRFTDDAGYGGDVLQFAEDETTVYAIHRTWTLRPEQHREQRLKSSKIADHTITKGCINVEPAVYAELVSCCSHDKLLITR